MKNPSCVVVGAGPGGIVATKELLEHGISDIVCLERGIASVESLPVLTTISP